MADLAARLGLPETAIEVLSVDELEMPLGRLGCPPDQGAGGLVLGQVVRLRAGGKEYEYRRHLRQVVYCGEIAP